MKSKITKRYEMILSKLNTVGYKFSPAEFISKYAETRSSSCSIRSYRTTVQTSLKIALDEGVLRKESGKNKIPEWFENLKSVLYWQEQLRSSKYNNLKKSLMST